MATLLVCAVWASGASAGSHGKIVAVPHGNPVPDGAGAPLNLFPVSTLSLSRLAERCISGVRRRAQALLHDDL